MRTMENFSEFNEILECMFNVNTKKSNSFDYSEWNEEKTELTIFIKAAGFSKKDISIETQGKKISIIGKMSNKNLSRIFDNQFHYVLKEDYLNTKSIKAELKNGILEIKLQRSKEKEIRSIEID